MKAKDITLEELKTYDTYGTVGELLEFIKRHNIPMDAKILAQRVEDKYFEKHGWGSVKKQGDEYYSIKRLVDKAKSGEFSDKDRYPKMTQGMIDDILVYEKELSNTLDEYHPIWCPVKYKDDDNLYLDLHY
jgi:hypothetical protein